ncbi:U6 snRNA-associated Sm-like protein LSm1 isoform X1 [Heliangelus exortis]|uniref:U6 snRNA-associated Sm-like protein LSm1 isoform X1 n=1 Tax=Heliangelus exortis TaxID=472823 RepID=UPI003A9501B7
MNYMPGTASLIQDIDKKHLVLLRDGRTLIGYLRSIDQFANLVLHQTVERIHVGKKYGDIPRGIFVVRGENVVLLGEIDLEKESDTPLQQVSIEEILEEQRVEQQAKQESEKLKVKGEQTMPLVPPGGEGGEEEVLGCPRGQPGVLGSWSVCVQEVNPGVLRVFLLFFLLLLLW